MADNFVANPGTGGSTFAADDIGGVFYPRVKVTWGADGVANDANATTPMPVQISGYASGGLTIMRSLDLDETEEDVGSGAYHCIRCVDHEHSNVYPFYQVLQRLRCLNNGWFDDSCHYHWHSGQLV